MLAATVLTLLLVPVFYAVIEGMRDGPDIHPKRRKVIPRSGLKRPNRRWKQEQCKNGNLLSVLPLLWLRVLLATSRRVTARSAPSPPPRRRRCPCR